MPATLPSLASCAVAEALGTFLLVFFGCGSVHTAVLVGAQSGLWQVAIVWGVAIMIAIFCVGAVSGAHINPAMTLAFASRGRFPWSRVPVYLGSQLVGAFGAAGVLFLLFHPFLDEKERQKRVIRGQPGSEITAMCYGEYYPNPDRHAGGAAPYDAAEHNRLRYLVEEPAAFGAEFIGTALLALAVFALVDPRNAAAPLGRMAPVFIGLTVSILISVIAPLTQACFNPARDFGPRLFAFCAGWGEIAIPGPNGRGFFTVYILAPILGAMSGGLLYDRVLRPATAREVTERTEIDEPASVA
ncbi:MAG: MIP/aquaporin family protein [Gemmataceae bacterium]